MTVGNSTTHAHAILNVLRNTAYSAIAAVYMQLHTADPGSAGTTGASTAARQQLTLGAPSAGSSTGTIGSNFSITATETISHFSLWTASSGGTFIGSGTFSASRSVVSGDQIALSSFTASITPIAA